MPLKVMGSAKKTYCKNLNKRLGRSLNSLSKFFHLGAYSTFRKLRNIIIFWMHVYGASKLLSRYIFKIKQRNFQITPNSTK